MKDLNKMTSAQTRQKFVDYFKRNGHTQVRSSSLIPENDPTLLFANAGMNQFKNLFLGLEMRDYTRAVSSQKCVRAGGKHNDLENVGFTARHHTFFEMLGNFSFGDYFKKEAIHFAWEFLTKDLGLPKERLYVSVFKDDDESAQIWHKQEGIPVDRIFRFGEKDNFWRMGDTGPCGPCTEIFYNHGEILSPEAALKSVEAGEDHVIEIWNLVLMQYFEKAPGVMESLPKPSVDTGAGLERISAIMQGKINNYDTDLFTPMIERALKQVSRKQHLIDLMHGALPSSQITDELRQEQAALRVLADHARSTAFLIADGALPSNEGRGYVLRRIMRRAIRYGRKLSVDHSFVVPMIETLIGEMSSFYPELKERQDIILTTTKDEESRFIQTLDQGTEILNQELAKLKQKNQKALSGDMVFKLYDTFGFPVDLTRVMANEQGIQVDEKEFEDRMSAAREKAKSSWKGKGLATDEAHLIQMANESLQRNGPTGFRGYETLSGDGQILALSNGHKIVNKLIVGEAGIVILDNTPFYAEGGGQAGDVGHGKSGGAEFKIHNCTKTNDIHMHHIEVTRGEIQLGAACHLEVQDSARRATAANHSATHLLHSALRKTLGSHVTQAGSLVDTIKLRFDYTHNKPLAPEEVQKIEELVNAEIARANQVGSTITSHKEALSQGAMALFGEKYGDKVRVIKMGDFSTELCGGTHVSNTSQIRLFKIVSEAGVSAGVRRIEALTSDNALKYLLNLSHENLKARQLAGIQENWTQISESNSLTTLTDWLEAKKTEIKDLEKEIKKLKGGQVSVESLAASAQKFSSQGVSGTYLMCEVDIDDREVLAQLTDQLKNKIGQGVVVVLGKGENTHPLIVASTKDVNQKFGAGAILKDLAAVMGGKGGGRPDFAQGAVPDRGQFKEATQKLKTLLS